MRSRPGVCTLITALCVLGPALAAAAGPWSPAPGHVRIAADRYSGGWALAANAGLDTIAGALARKTGCRAVVDEPLKALPLRVDLGPRPAERLFQVLARRAGARLEVRYVVTPLASGEPVFRGARAFAEEPAELELREPTPLDEALQELNVPIRIAGEVDGYVRLLAPSQPLRRILDRLCEQVQGCWHAEVRITARRPADAEAAADERRRAHFDDLSGLPPDERRDELAADLERIERLPPADREAALRRTADDVLSMAEHLRRTPGEHRGPVWEGVSGIANDYATVLDRMPGSRRERYAPIAAALGQLRIRLSGIR